MQYKSNVMQVFLMEVLLENYENNDRGFISETRKNYLFFS